SLLRELWGWKDRDARDLVGHLLLASRGPLAAVPALDELVEETIVRPLSGREEFQINALLEAAAVRATRAAPTIVIKAATPASLETAAVGLAPREAAVRTAPARPIPPPLPPMPPPLSRPEPPLEAAGEQTADVAAPLDPLVSFLSRPLFLASMGGVALLSFL